MIILKFPFKAISKDNEKLYNKQSNRAFTSKKFKDFEAMIKLYARNQYKVQPLVGDLKMTIFFSFKDKRHCDLFNLPKCIADALQRICNTNDKQIKEAQLGIMEGTDEDCFSVQVWEL